jgi:ABC-type phosphate/phosphonate transport system substrate-binding protein
MGRIACRSIIVFSLLATGLSASLNLAPASSEPNEAAVRIGMVNSLFRDIPESTVKAMMNPFSAIMQAQTGVRGELVMGGDMNTLADELAADKVQLGVFHGVEFAWVRAKHPELRPLAIAVNQDPHLHALVVVRAENNAADMSCFQDQVLAMPQQSKIHCHLFLERCCRVGRKPAQQFFSKVATPPNAEEALDDVIDKEASVAIVDGVAFETFKRRKPGRAARLRIVATSDVFPSAVIAYRPGTLDEPTLNKFRSGLFNANQNVMGKQMLTLWKLTAFEAVPADYEQNLADIAKAYPAPGK